ncbi:AarF/UbiB family protein [Metasolibacillus sp.]|uniref:ABC1 kinase family protein n=1 Tax=Metasolibacillus sp. TaxID=2703680 RepID=UPI0025F5BFF9|nr:AarF/UbiB family protein [Metasolibacillus sp.]MCT6925721.1 AarF/UbiB family protein [Metasolibacillus sp.]MCT6941877.1 AarF/UbiB family protein [Metasolibacillus sp.]
MSGLHFVIQVVLFSIVIFFLSGRLIGSQVNLLRRILSVVLSVALTTFVFWYTYVRGTDYWTGDMVQNVINVATLLWVGSMLLISMLFYLLFELFDPIAIDENGVRIKGRKSLIMRVIQQWRRQKRLRQVVQIAVTNGITRTVKYARNRDNDRELAIALRDTLEQCGGIFIKFGQVLSTRKELFSPVFIDELKKLQQNVKPLTEEQVNAVLQANLAQPMEEVFSYFSQEPIAAASIGQVHKAVLRATNEQVAVKLLRPDVKEIMRDDLSILVEFAQWVSSKSMWAENLGFRDLAVGFASSLMEEIDFQIEARNTQQVANVLRGSEYKVYIPKIYTQYSNSNILVMEYIDGKSVAQAETLYEHFQIDRHLLAKNLFHSFLEQALVSGIFHADPHPGNIYITSRTGMLTMLDFGAVGRLAEKQQDGLKQFLIGIALNDANVVYEGITELVDNAMEVNEEEVEQAIGQVLLKISYAENVQTDELIYSIFSIVREFGLHFYPSVSTALRALVTLDGTLSIIDPKFAIFQEAREFSSHYIEASMKRPFKEPLATKNRLEEELALILPMVRKIPRRMNRMFKKMESGKIILHHDVFSDKHNAMFVTQLFSRFVLLFVGITFGIISVALLAISQFMHTAYAIYLNTIAYVGLFLCAILLVRLSIQAIRDMKRT